MPKTNEVSDWKKEVRSWYKAYSKEEKLLVLNTQERMIEFIEEIIHLAELRAVEEERKRIAKGFEPVRKDLARAVQVLNKHNMKNSARELRDDLGYMVHLIAGHTEEDCIKQLTNNKGLNNVTE